MTATTANLLLKRGKQETKAAPCCDWQEKGKDNVRQGNYSTQNNAADHRRDLHKCSNQLYSSPTFE